MPLSFRIMEYGNFVSLSRSYSEYEDKEQEYMYGSQNKVLLADSFQGEKLFLDISQNSIYSGFVFSYKPYGSLAGELAPIYDSLELMVKSLIIMFKSGAMNYDEESDFLDIDFDVVAKIGATFNPRSSYWK